MLAALVLRNFGDFITVNFLPETPMEFLNASFLLLALWLTYEGIEVSARVNQIFVGIILLLFTTGVLTSIPDMDVDNLKPFLSLGIKPIIPGLLLIWGFPLAEIISISFLFTHLRSPQKALPIMALAVCAGSLGLFIATILSIATFGPNLTASMTYPVLQLDKFVSIGGFLERTEILTMSILVLSGFVKITLCYKGAFVYLTDFIGVKKSNSLLLPLAAIIFSLSFLLYRNTIHQLNFATQIWPYYSITMAFIIPLFLLSIALFKNRNQLPPSPRVKRGNN